MCTTILTILGVAGAFVLGAITGIVTLALSDARKLRLEALKYELERRVELAEPGDMVHIPAGLSIKEI